MSMIPEITPDQIDDWFKIGKKTAKIKTVPKSFSGGRAIDPVTLQPKQPQHQHIPHYKRKGKAIKETADKSVIVQQTPIKSKEAVHSTPAGKEAVVPSFPVSDISESNGGSETEMSEDSLITRYTVRAKATDKSFIEISYEVLPEEKDKEESYRPESDWSDEEEEYSSDSDVTDDFVLEMTLHNPDDDETVPIVEVADRVIGLSFEDSSDEETELSEDNGSRSIPRDHVREPKSICFEENLLQLAKMKVSSLCHVKGCDGIVDMKTKYTGSTVRIIWGCSKGHHVKTWDSQPVVRRMRVGDVLLSSAILLSGNNFEKVKLMFSFLGLRIMSRSSNFKIQQKHCCPIIEREFAQMTEKNIEKYIGKEVVVLGDGRMDSPGHSAQYCTYTLMENETKDILASVIIDKRMTNLVSTSMEKEGLIRAMKLLADKGVIVKELVTDASSTIAAMIKKETPDVVHSFDIWHGAKNLGKKLGAVAAESRNKDLRPWVPHIINHFWYCCRNSLGKEEVLLARWRGALHHVVNKHEWISGDGAIEPKCEHESLEKDDDKWLESGTDAHVALTKVMLDTRFLHNIHRYVNFRHTGDLETFHEHILMYCAKRFAYTYPVYKARNHLAAIDYQSHKDRPLLLNKNGEFRKPDFHGGHDYAEEYQREEDEKLISRSSFVTGDDAMSVVSSHLEALELDSTIAGTEVLPTDLAPENATQVYGVYNFNHRYDDRLPISRFKEQVVNTIESNQVTVIQGATGSGKTTQVAQYILDFYARQSKYCNIIVTQPRRIAAISIARRVCQERNWPLGSICGYQVGLDREAGDDTRILYCTTGILLNKLINEKNMHKYTHVILDEVHERDQDTDFSLLVVRKLLRTNSRHTKVVLMSATFDSEMFAQYFAMPVRDRLEQAPVVDVEGKPFKVNEYYAEDLTQLGPVPALEESDPHISQEALNLAVELIKHFDTLEEKEQGLDGNTGFAPVRGTVLVFLPGLAEISNLEEALFKLSAKHQLRLIPLHSTITMEEQGQVFSQPSAGFRKVILSTNIAESSITVPDIKYVIDFCLTKNLVCDFDTNYTSLQVHWASVANCTQRKGRAGRVSNGRVYRLVTRHFFEKRLPEYGIPEMRRCPLDKLILQVKVLDLGEPKAILALALSPPNLDDIERNILTLKEVGALSTKGSGNRHDGELTFVGRVLADLPVDTKIGKLLMLGHVFGLLEECLIIGAAMSLKSVFAQPFKFKLEAYRHKLEWANGSQSDSLAILNAYRTWERKREQGEFKRSGGGGEVGWGKNFYLQIRRLKEIQELIKDIEKRLMKFNIIRPQHPPVYEHVLSEDQEKLLLKIVLCGAFYPNYFVKGEIDEMESLKALSGRDPLNTVMVKGLPANQGTLYKQAVEDLFRKCGANPKAYFEETRAYVEFPRRTNSRSKVHEGVYMALKMKQLRMPMVINLYTPDEARDMLTKLQDAQDKLTQSGSLRTNRLTATGQITEESGSNRVATHVSPPDPAKDVISICITEVIDCGHFWAQYGEDENYRDLFKVQEELNKDHGCSLRPLSGVARVGMFCVAPFMDETLEYYRARIQSVQNKVDERVRARREIVEVFFVDYGNTAEMSRDQLRELPSHLLKTPFQAFECRLIKIRPSPIKCPDGKWTAEATNAFREMVLNHKLIARPFSVVHGVLRVDLIHVTQQYGQFYVGQELIEMGFADEAEESSLSKQSNEQRTEEYMKARNLFGRATQKGTLLGEPKPEWLNVASLGATGYDLGARQKGNRVHLNGPTNPYEMNFFNMTNMGRLRATKIEQDSVNSVSIDDEPHDPHQRMMVSGFVGLNPSGSSVVARDTTVMPPIPGLPALILLLFTPVAEFRVDPQKTRYIGAICGLGTDPVYGHSELPDHDIEVQFDVKFNNEDIVEINGVRMAINFAIGNQSQVAAWGPDAVCSLQDGARHRIMNLIQKRREPCEAITPQRIYEWNQVDPDDVIPHTVNVGEEAQLLNYHSAICLDVDDSDIPEVTKQKEMMLKHVQYLRQVVKSNTKRTPTLCEMCNVTCPTTQLLALHLETQMHKRNEDNFT